MLKALELNGFKSFADKTRIEFDAGVTCVVGPNGSGKSNVVDAIKWVAGTQSAKALRGKEMTDVIFSGSASRKPMNAAEVTLEFDNSSGLFDVQSPVARITRRVYRSGEGEYLINNAPSRLRDIRSLLAGTGVGSESYSIIEQGRVDAMLRASPRDRRAIFEEAAGVSRFRLKKHEAAKRLARVEQNLLRLSDIVDEVEGRLRRVKKQAGKAQRYRESADRLKNLRTELGVTDYHAFAERSGRLNGELQQIQRQNAHDAQTLEAAETELERLESEDAVAVAGLRNLDQRLADVREQMGAARATSIASAERFEELQQELLQKQKRLAIEFSQSTRSEAEPRIDLAEQLAKAQRERDAASERFEQAQQQHAELSKAVHQCEDQAKENAGLLSSAISTTEENKRREKQLAQALTSEQARHESLFKKSLAAASDIERLSAALIDAQEAVSQAAERMELSAAALAERHAGTASLRGRLAETQKQLASNQAEAVGLRHKLEAINQLENDLKSLHTGLASQSGPASWRAMGIVADVLHVDYDSAPMVEAALGERAHHMVVDSGQAVIQQLASGVTELAARTSLERLDSQPPASVVDRVDLTGETGVMGRADQFVECDAELQPLVRRLLGRVWFVDTLETAERLASGPGRGLSFVTYLGESLTADGVLTVGPKSDTRNLFTRKARAGEFREDLTKVEGTIEQLTGKVAELERQVTESQAAERDDLQIRTQAADTHSEARHALGRVEEQLAEKRRELDKRTRAAQEAECAAGDHEAKLTALQLDLNEQTPVVAQLQEESEVLGKQKADLGKNADQLRQQAVDAQVELARAEQRLEVLQSQKSQARLSSDDLDRSRQDAVEEVVACRIRIQQQQLAQLATRSLIDGLSLDIEHLTRGRQSSQCAVTELQQSRTAIAQALRERRSQSDRLVEQQQRIELELAKLSQERTTLIGRLRDDYGIDLEQAAQSHTTTEIDDRQALEREIASLREDVGGVGPVNLESIEELDDLESRFDDLSKQYQDLSTAKNSLERLMQRLSVESRKLFLSAIEAVRGEFRELFRQLFGGGEADLILVEGDGDDPLEAGVEIAAQPPGKELSNISLLSGGEKTMTCVALLLALFRTKPSPFCVLDEVDAALDEANIGRFTGVLSEFLSSTQFIVITHSKKTMTGAHTMYGITMQESGISKQVAVRFEEVDDKGNILPNRMLSTQAKAA